jgi:hypothetical protein
MEDPAPLTITLEPLDDHLIVEPFDEDVGYDVRLGGVACKVLSRRELIARIHD